MKQQKRKRQIYLNFMHKNRDLKYNFSELLETKEKLLNKENELKLAIENAGESNQLLNQVENLKIKLRKAEETHIK